MVDVQVSVATTVAPDRVRSALTDFPGRRLQLFPNLDRRFYQVHRDPAGGTWAEVTEGSALAGGIWERGRYDWSAPGQVRFDVADSNAFRRGSYWEYRIRPDGRGGSRVDLTVHRVPGTLKGQLLALLPRPFGRRILRDDLARSLELLAAELPA